MWLLRLGLAAFGFVLGFVLPWLVYLDSIVAGRFDLATPDVASRVYARPLVLKAGLVLPQDMLNTELGLLRYLKQAVAVAPGSYSERAERMILHTRAFTFEDGPQAARQVLIRIQGGKITALKDVASGSDLEQWRVDPVRIATLYGSGGAERQPEPIEQMPTLLVSGLQAVEDRNFKSHYGVDPLGLARAMWSNFRNGRMSQGGSTLTQQLVKNTLLTSDRNIERKLKEMGLALMLERRYEKKIILEAYLNRVVLGQSGSQPVQGFPAASEFYFGRSLDDLAPHETALLVGILKATTQFDPRRAPARALERRNVVLRQFFETGLLEAKTYELAKKAPLSVLPRPSSARDRYPAFQQLVRAQLARDYDSAALFSQGLQILTTLDPKIQERAEAALTSTLAKLDPGGPLQGALVLSENATGDVLAIVGSRDPRSSNFNHALDAKRPVGSLLKPFVYLLALSEPARYGLASMISDAPLTVKLDGNRTWNPQNYDQRSHGTVALIEALARSYNLATARIGLDLGVERLAELITALGVEVPRPAQPSMILGSVDLSPLQVTQLYQSLASGGRVLPLTAVRAVMDRNGRALKRYPRVGLKPPSSEAIKLVTLALNETTRSGTAGSLVGQVKIDVAGKTGTSNDKRDSWYAGYTGEHLGVVWIGRDDNQATTLTGATGALKIWSALFRALPSTPLRLKFAPDVRWVAYDLGGGCDKYRFLPALAPYEPSNTRSCMNYLTAP